MTVVLDLPGSDFEQLNECTDRATGMDFHGPAG